MNNNVELAYLIQESYDIIKQNKKILRDGSYIYLLKKLKNEFETAKKNYVVRKKELAKIKENYAAISIDLRCEREKMENNEYKLYNKVGSDLNAIEKLEHAIEGEKQIIKKLEDEAVDLLDEEEKLKSEIENLRVELVNIKDNFYDYKGKSSEKVEKARQELIAAKLKIEEIKGKIPKDLFEEISSLMMRSSCAVAKVSGEICGGCKMKVSSMTIDNLVNNNSIVHCDNCGRILYYDESEGKLKRKYKRKIRA
ncbi:zinc ribbon domain-containing protein [Clostridium felsineum]|uniref:zinc ribbon domain-containing protein n=1 Tax=Clostridium felsineum TaxID=36839 RepID=UPI00098BF4B5|nr:zinc ribbon domain-containing protein [Clostridium felsineum]URZ15776.1 hypothetical protein CLFE_018230 [Clostridium felsineum DSM 794]